MKFGETAKKARETEGLTLKEASEKIGVSSKTISNWESDEQGGTLPSSEKFVKMMLVYGKSGKSLLQFYLDLFGEGSDTSFLTNDDYMQDDPVGHKFSPVTKPIERSSSLQSEDDLDELPPEILKEIAERPYIAKVNRLEAEDFGDDELKDVLASYEQYIRKKVIYEAKQSLTRKSKEKASGNSLDGEKGT